MYGPRELQTRSRGGIYAVSETFPFIREAVRFLPVASCARWGAITHKADGSPDFHAVLSHEGAAKAVLFAFDLLELEGQDLRPSVLEERWVLLGEVLFEPREGLKVVAQCEG